MLCKQSSTSSSPEPRRQTSQCHILTLSLDRGQEFCACLKNPFLDRFYYDFWSDREREPPQLYWVSSSEAQGTKRETWPTIDFPPTLDFYMSARPTLFDVHICISSGSNHENQKYAQKLSLANSRFIALALKHRCHKRSLFHKCLCNCCQLVCTSVDLGASKTTTLLGPILVNLHAIS